MSLATSELTGKRLDLLKEVIPKLTRLTILGDISRQVEIQETEKAARVLGLTVALVEFRLEALMRALAVELGDKGIVADAIAPGFFLTDANATFFAQPRIAELARRIPLQRFGRPDELVGASAIFLASDAASYITAQVLTVDAGLSVAL